jgi:hypothetical protein
LVYYTFLQYLALCVCSENFINLLDGGREDFIQSGITNFEAKKEKVEKANRA